mgnify:FL=1|jgi:hypothetical protein|tara:strand:- start:249 stop:563 length:315 start_codon:yes stop_codon:yes gene_type:complete
MGKYINTETATKLPLSSTACALLLPIMLLANKNNEIEKSVIIKSINWITDYRTWDKYWTELVDIGILIQLDNKRWMLSPHECYTDDISHNSLITKWNEVRNAIK